MLQLILTNYRLLPQKCDGNVEKRRKKNHQYFNHVSAALVAPIRYYYSTFHRDCCFFVYEKDIGS